MPRLLLIDDSAPLRGAIRRTLEASGYEVLEASSGREGLRKAQRHRPSLILTDWVMGGELSGISLCARLKGRPETRPIPIVVMTGARVDFADELEALSHGADLYLTKDEVLAQGGRGERFLAYLASLIERPARLGGAGGNSAGARTISLDLDEHSVKTPHGTIEDLSATLFALLRLLAQRQPRLATRRYLLGALWGSSVRQRTLDVAVSRLKARLERTRDEFIECVVRRGYRLKVPAAVLGAAGRAA